MFSVIALQDCPYSEQAVKILENIPQSKIKWVTQDNKSSYKKGDRQTFPQISYLVKGKSKTHEIYIGGLHDLQELLEVVQHLKEKNYDAKIIAPLLHLLKK